MNACARIDTATLRLWLAEGSAVVVDVREPAEYAREHIAGARAMPLSSFDAAALPRGRCIVLCCASGNRSQTAARKLLAAGTQDVADLKGGLTSWKAAGLPLVQDRTAPISLMRQTQIAAGALIVLGTALGALVSPWFLLLAGGVGAGLILAGVTDSCLMMRLLSRLPYNRPRPQPRIPGQPA